MASDITVVCDHYSEMLVSWCVIVWVFTVFCAKNLAKKDFFRKYRDYITFMLKFISLMSHWQGSQLSWNSWFSWNFKIVLKLSWNQKLSWNFSHLVRMSWYWPLLCRPPSYGVVAFILLGYPITGLFILLMLSVQYCFQLWQFIVLCVTLP